jgi:hypothetical protein
MARAHSQCLTDEVFACGVDVCGRSPLDGVALCRARKRWALPYGVSLAARGSCGDVAARERRGGYSANGSGDGHARTPIERPTSAAGT